VIIGGRTALGLEPSFICVRRVLWGELSTVDVPESGNLAETFRGEFPTISGLALSNVKPLAAFKLNRRDIEPRLEVVD
jgi:hypothetical protein